MHAASEKAVVARATAAGVAQAAVWLVLGATLIRVVLQFQKVFTDFGVELPAITVLLISLSYLLGNYWYVAFLLICLWPVVNRGVVRKWWSSPEKALARRAWYVVTWVAPISFFVFAAVALLVPMLALIIRLQ